MSTEVKFCVAAKPLPGEGVFVVGSCEELGRWLPHLAIPLQKSEQAPNEGSAFKSIMLLIISFFSYNDF